MNITNTNGGLINPKWSIDHEKRHFIYTDITEAFMTYIKISFVASIYTCFPVIAYHMWMFLVPGLYDDEKRKLGVFCFLSFLLFSLGCMIAYFFIFPVAWKFFLSFENLDTEGLFNIRLEPKINQYLFLVLKILFLFGICFQYPMYLILLVQMSIISSGWFIRKRNFSCVLSFIVAALLSPPDIISQVILVIPILFFYELAIFTMKLLEEYKRMENCS
jgi:sec-independent protein translocase protein TatC